MTNFGNLPFEKLLAYQEARKLLDAVRESAISEGRLKDQALRAATSVCLNISEGAGRAGSADKARVYAIARGENCEVAASLGTERDRRIDASGAPRGNGARNQGHAAQDRRDANEC